MRIIKIVFTLLLLSGVSHAQVIVKGRIDHVIPDGVDTLGNIYLTVSGGTSPYTYTWNPGGSNVKDLTNATRDSYTVTVKDNAGSTVNYKYKLGYKTKWTNFISCFFRNDSLYGQTLTPYYPATGLNTSISKNTLKAGQDGWVQWVVGPTTYQVMLGFIDSTAVGGTGLYSDIDYGIYQNGGSFWKVTAGVFSTYTTVASGDVLRMERVGTTLTYYKNNVSLVSYTVSNSRDWRLKIGLYGSYSNANIGSSFIDTTSSDFPNYVEDIVNIRHCAPGSSNGSIKLTPRISGTTHNYTWSPGGATTSSVTGLSVGSYSVDIKDSDSNISKYAYNVGYKTYWTNFYGTRAKNDTLTTATPSSVSGWSTMLSKNTLTTSANGWVEFVAKTQGYWYMIGFLDSASVISGVYTDIDYGVYMLQGGLYRVIGGVATALSGFRLGDVIRLERSGSNFYIKINGNAIFTTSCTTGNLKIKTAINTATISDIGASFVDTSNVNFPTYVEDAPVIKYCSPGSNNGSIALTPKISGTTHSYTWSPGGATTSSVTGLSVGINTVIIMDNDNNVSKYKYEVGYKTYWTDFFGSKIRNDSLLFNTPSSPTGWSPMLSKNTLKSGVDGWVQLVTKSTPDDYMVGFLDSLSAVSGVMSDVDFGVTFSTSFGLYKVVGSVLTYICAYKKSDLVRIERVGSVYNLKLNGVIVTTVTANPSLNLKIKAAIKNSAYANIGCSFYDSTNVVFPNYVNISSSTLGSEWDGNNGSVTLTPKYSGVYSYSWNPYELTSSITNKDVGRYSVIITDPNSNTNTYTYNIGYKGNWSQLSGITISGDTLKSTTSGWCNAVSSNTLEGNTDGWLEYTVSSISNNQVFGYLDSVLTLSNYTDIDYGVYLEASTKKLFSCKGGTTALLYYFGMGDVIRLERVGNTINYKLNNYLLATSTVPTTTLSNTWKVKCTIQNSGARVIGPPISFPVIVNRSYAKLKKYLDGGFYDVTIARNPFNAGKLFFVFEEEYLNNGTNLTCNIYKMDRTKIPVTTLTVAYKDNRYALNLPTVITSSSSTPNTYYILEVIDKKGEKTYLRFKY